jgi:hypothetical protein
MYNFLDYQLPDISFFVMKSALFVQANVAVNTKLTSKVPFLFGNFQVFFKKLVKNVQFRYGMTGMKILFRCPFQYPKVPLEAGAPQSFDASYAPGVQSTTTNEFLAIPQLVLQ